MSLEQAILDRLEKRNGQIAQLQSTVHALERAADSQREHAMLERGRLLEENKKLASALEVASSEAKKDRAMYVDEQRRANGLDRQLASACEDSNRKDREIGALKNEAGELLTHSFKLGRNNGENVKQFLDRICSEVPLESTREGLKNAVAKLQEVTTDRDRVLNELAAIVAECAELQGKYESLLAAQNTVKADVAMVYQIADKLGRNQAESIPEFMERQALRVAALESQAGKIGYVAKGEHEEAVTAARENGIHKGESLSGFIWRQCEGLRKSQAENAPLNKLFVVLCKQRGNLNEEIIYRAVDEASDAINKLTA